MARNSIRNVPCAAPGCCNLLFKGTQSQVCANHRHGIYCLCKRCSNKTPETTVKKGPPMPRAPNAAQLRRVAKPAKAHKPAPVLIIL